MGGRTLPERWEPSPPPRAAEAAEETAPGAAAGGPTARQFTREATRAAEVPAHTVETSGDVATATPVAATTSVEPRRKRKRGFSTIR
jgi:hypothetical protein